MYSVMFRQLKSIGSSKETPDVSCSFETSYAIAGASYSAQYCIANPLYGAVIKIAGSVGSSPSTIVKGGVIFTPIRRHRAPRARTGATAAITNVGPHFIGDETYAELAPETRQWIRRNQF